MYRLIYFPWAGRAGAIRDTLHIGGIPFEDVKLSYESFCAQRAQGVIPYDVLPALELPSGLVIGQSNTILRWAGDRAGLYPQDAEARLSMEATLDMLEDYATRLSVSIREDDAEIRAHLRRRLNSQCFPQVYRHLSKHVEDGGAEWLMGGQLTIVDLKAYHFVEKLTNGTLDGISTDALTGYPELNAWFERVSALRQTYHL